MGSDGYQGGIEGVGLLYVWLEKGRGTRYVRDGYKFNIKTKPLHCSRHLLVIEKKDSYFIVYLIY